MQTRQHTSTLAHHAPMRYAVVLNPGMDDEKVDSRHLFYSDALDTCRVLLAHGDDADIVKITQDGSYTYEF